MAQRKPKPEITDAGRAEMEKFQPDAEVKREFDEAARLGSEPREQVIHEVTLRPVRDEHADVVAAGDPDADTEVSAVGDETPQGQNPTPDMSVVEEIGQAEGVTYEDNETLRPLEKIEERDRKRWELDPASSEHFRERMEDEGEVEE